MFRPTYFHIWQLKTFWHERKIVDDDVEVHSFEEMEASPALESNLLRGELAQVVQEMKTFRQEMTQTLLRTDDNDIHSFWLRKTHKPVLAVLLVQSEGQAPILYRGTNMEVSMPTGSLCAERNVIGTALASNPKLKRHDLKCIAVLAVAPPSDTEAKPRSASQGNASDVCSSCVNSRHNSFDEAPTTTMTGRQMRHQSFNEEEEDDWMIGDANTRNNSAAVAPPNKTDDVILVEETTTNSTQEEMTESRGAPLRQISLFASNSSNSLVDMIKQHPSGPTSPHTSLRNNKTTSSSTSNAIQEKRTVIVRSNNHDVDLNPLRPCGACHEWLKKIAECNPYFQIMTFTDAECNGVYVTPCQE
jgi:cytidine deaminase